MDETIALKDLKTGKPHISFSELSEWSRCSWKHKLKFVDKIDLSTPGTALDVGTACHAAIESFIKTGVMDASVAETKVRALWSEHGHVDGVEQYVAQLNAILAELPAFLDNNFPGWKPVDAEHALYEMIEGKPHAFKGFIDIVIEAPGKRKGQVITWIIDAKTCAWGWHSMKKSDPIVRSQLIYYKNFYAKKKGIDMKDVRCAFLLLKRTAKDGERCELVQVSAGDKTIKRSLTVINNMLASITRGIALKNKSACQYCEYRGTEHCP